jgi:hypothetical protein
MQRDAQSKSPCRQTSEQSAGSYEATRRREFRKKFVPTLPPFCKKFVLLLSSSSPSSSCPIFVFFTFFVNSRFLVLGVLTFRPQIFVFVSSLFVCSSSSQSLRSPISGSSPWSHRMSAASAFIYRHSACLSVGGILSQRLLPVSWSSRFLTSSCHCQF